MKVGFIGTGAMGKPMAHNIIKAGHSLAVFARNPEKIAELLHAGASPANCPAEVASRSEAVFLSLPADREVDEVVSGERGVLEAASAGTILIDTTTGTPSAARRVAEQAAKKQVFYLDVPVSGGVKGAREGTLTLMIGGERAAVQKVRSLLQSIGQNIYEVGPVGAGRTLKAINQIIAGLNAAVVCESLVLARSAGISPETLLEILGKSAANSYQLQTKLAQFIIPGKFEGGFRINLMLKDLDIAMEMARQLRIPAFLASQGAELYRAAAAGGYSDKDTSGMVLFLSSLAGMNFYGEHGSRRE
jgi:3-hydroxyisobutyrate dehydrogenase-like beta-hydroxyacid dehydrogenase